MDGLPRFPFQPAWYALRTKPRHEKAACQALGSKELTVFNPMSRVRRRWSDRTKEVDVVLFPGYVFCHFGFAQRMSVLSTPCVASIVSVGKEPAAIEDDQISAIRAIILSGRPAVPCPYLASGNAVRLTGGCLDGLTGTVLREKNLCRVVVTIELLQRSVSVEVDGSDLAPASVARPHDGRTGRRAPLPSSIDANLLLNT